MPAFFAIFFNHLGFVWLVFFFTAGFSWDSSPLNHHHHLVEHIFASRIFHPIRGSSSRKIQVIDLELSQRDFSMATEGFFLVVVHS